MISNPEQTLTTRILATWASMAAHSGDVEQIVHYTARLGADAEHLLMTAGATEEDAIASASALEEGMRQEALTTSQRVLDSARFENLSPQATRVRLHDALAVRDLDALTARHLVVVSKVNAQLDPGQARRQLALRLATTRAQSLARTTMRCAHAVA